MVAVSLHRLSPTLQALKIPEGSKVYVLAKEMMVLATSEPSDGVMAAHLADFRSGCAGVSRCRGPEAEQGRCFPDAGRQQVPRSRLRVIQRAFVRGLAACNGHPAVHVCWRHRCEYASACCSSSPALPCLAAVDGRPVCKVLFARPLSRLASSCTWSSGSNSTTSATIQRCWPN